MATAGTGLTTLDAHEFVPRSQLSGAYPPNPGTGWLVEAYIDLPAEAVQSLIAAENYVDGLAPDFTFRTPWIDFPAGPADSALDADLETLGDFLNDHIYDLSDPSMVDEPMSHFFLRFTGYLKVRLSDETRTELAFVGLPVWVDLATQGYDGYRTKVGETTAYRAPDVNLNNIPWTHFGPAVERLGLFPITVTYFNRFDPQGNLGAPRAGIELYSYYSESDRFYPAGGQMLHPTFGFGRLVPPDVIYQDEDLQPILPGDFDGDTDIDLIDYQWLQFCGDPTFFILPSGCHAYDFDGNNQISREEINLFLAAFAGPVIPDAQRAAEPTYGQPDSTASKRNTLPPAPSRIDSSAPPERRTNP
jgi:hypothetical protein